MVQLVTLSERIEGLKNENRNLWEEIVKLKEESITKEQFSAFEKRVEMVIEEKDKLQNDLKKEKEKYENLTKAFKKLQNENEELKKTVHTIKEELENKKKRLVFGQIAWILEEKIWDIVLPAEAKGSTAYLRSMENWLDEDDPSDEQEMARKRWADLKDRLKWKDRRHKHALYVLKQTGKDGAHPPFDDLDEARKQLRESKEIAKLDKKACHEIIDMIILLEM